MNNRFFKLLLFLAIIVFVAIPNQVVYAATGVFGGQVCLNNKGVLSCSATNMTTTDLGKFGCSTTLKLTGGAIDTYKNSGGDVTGATLYYRIYPTSSGASGSYTGLDLPWLCNRPNGECSGFSSDGDQRWKKSDHNIDLLAGFGPGNYTLEIYMQASSNEGDRYWSNSGSNWKYTYTVLPRSKQTGNWSVASTWLGDVVPNSTSDEVEICSGYTVTLDADVSVKSLKINSGAGFDGGNGVKTLVVANGGSLTNNGTFTRNTETISFLGYGTVVGTVAFNNVTIAGAVDFGIASAIHGVLQISANGSLGGSHYVTYADTSTLKYNTGAQYNINIEWPMGTGMSVPKNVQISGSGTLLNSNSGERTARGNITIDVGATLQLNQSGSQILKIGGNLTNNGAFLINYNAVWFNGGDQSISVIATTSFDSVYFAGSGTKTLNSLFKLRGILQINSGVTLSAGSRTIDFEDSPSTLHRDFINNGTFDAGTGTVAFDGHGNYNTRVYGSSTTVFNNVSVYASPSNIFGVDFYDDATGRRAEINGTLTLRQGTFVADEEVGSNGSTNIKDGRPKYNNGSKLLYTTNSAFNSAAEWMNSANCSDPGVPWNVQLSGVTLNLTAEYHYANLTQVYPANSNKRACGNITIDSGSTLQTTGGTLTIDGNLTNNGTFTHNSGTIAFNGGASAIIQAAGKTTCFHNLMVNSGAVLTAPATIIEINGDWTNDGSFAHHSGSVTFVGGVGTQNITGSSQTQFNTLNNRTSGTSGNDRILHDISTTAATALTFNNYGVMRRDWMPAAGVSYTFGLTRVTITVDSLSGSSPSIRVDRLDMDHAAKTGTGPSGTPPWGVGWGIYWDITSANIDSIQADLSLPTVADSTGLLPGTAGNADFSENAGSKLCKYSGSGILWDCRNGDGDMNNTVTFDDTTSFSKWGLGHNVSPTAINLVSLEAHSDRLDGLGWLSGIGLLFVLILILNRRR
ncbi:MAG TPA: hypothetical protein VFF78_03745 [Anaerolineaceae bacterium]|nr:hypothetical protein [Anaerolineaceae bacterium]